MIRLLVYQCGQWAPELAFQSHSQLAGSWAEAPRPRPEPGRHGHRGAVLPRGRASLGSGGLPAWGEHKAPFFSSSQGDESQPR